jgi:hypothetical protein
MANETKPASTSITALREGKVTLGVGAAGLVTLALDALGGEGSINLTDMQKNIVLIGVIAVAVSFIHSRGQAKHESR